MSWLSHPVFLLVYRGDRYQGGLVLWFSCSAFRGGWSSRSACRFVVVSRALLFPLRVPGSVEQGWAGMGQAPACRSDLCVSGIARVTACFFQTVSNPSFSGFCTCSGVKFRNIGGAHCPRYLPMLFHTPCHSWLSCLRADLWIAFLNSCLILNKT